MDVGADVVGLASLAFDARRRSAAAPRVAFRKGLERTAASGPLVGRL